MNFGDTITVETKLVRHSTYKGHQLWKEWGVTLIKPTKCLFLGYRHISNGKIWRDSDGIEYTPKEHMKVALVIPVDGKRNPFYTQL